MISKQMGQINYVHWW